MACVLCQGASAQQPIIPFDKYLLPLVEAERAVSDLRTSGPRTPEVDADVLRHASQLQTLGTQRAFTGDTEGAMAAFDLLSSSRGASRPASADQIAKLADLGTEDAIQAIVEQARTRRVVLLNEAHHLPMHRAFAMKLAAALRRIGYRYLACETFSSPEDSARTQETGQVTFSSGYYTKDPVFAGFVRAAVADGWQLVSYEHVGDAQADPAQRLAQREEGQARNLVERIFAKDKDAKVFIYVGYGHLQKSPPDSPGSIMFMGEYLHRMTGLDMLHVDQTAFFPHPQRDADNPVYDALVAKSSSGAPFVLRAADGSHPVLLGMQARLDMQVIHPRYGMLDGRPAWLRTLAGRSPRAIPAALLPRAGRRIVKAYRVDDPQDAVPVDVVLVEAGKPAPTLMLPAGEFRFGYEE